MQHTGLFRAMQASCIRRDQQVSRCVPAFCLEALQQCIGLARDQVDADTCLFREFVEQRLDQLFLAGRVEIDLPRGSCEQRGEDEGRSCEKRNQAFHGCLRNSVNRMGVNITHNANHYQLHLHKMFFSAYYGNFGVQ